MDENRDPLSYDTYMLVVAHPDDAEFSSAGTVTKLSREGKRVVLIQVTSGDRGAPDTSLQPEELGKRREAEQLEAAKRVGMAEVVFLREGDGHVMPDIDLREKIVRQIRTHKPDVIITHDPFRPYAMHPDHRGVGMATHDAVYPTARDPLYFPQHLEEGLDSHKTAEIWYFGSEVPDVFVDITDTFDNKLHALKAHVSQVGDGSRLNGMLRDRSRELAKDQPFELAEAYKSVKMRR